jgi:hypothetical protein
MQAVVGGNIVYPSLTEVCNLFRTQINDTGNNTMGSGTGTGAQQGVIMPNSNPDLLTFLTSGINTLFSDLRNVGSPELILDNYILTGLPALTQQNAAVQVSIAYSGFFDGFQWHSQWTLPIGTSRVLALYERQTGINEDFVPMQPAPFGLPSVLQGQRQAFWEMRQGQVWMPGATVQTDIRIRTRIAFPTLLSPKNLNFDTTYIPILNCGDAVMAKMLKRYATRFAPESYQMAKDMETDEMDKLKFEAVRQMQANENQRAAFGDEAVTDFGIAWSWL